MTYEIHLEEMRKASLVNCHCRGLDSLVFKGAPFMVRAFVAREDHELYRNRPEYPGTMSIALHAHHCDVTLLPIFGDIYNVAPYGGAFGRVKSLRSFTYESAIAHGAGRFTPKGEPIPRSLAMDRLTGPRFMAAEERHSVYVPRGHAAAWWIVEGRESPSPNNVVYSDDRLEEFDFSALNLQMPRRRLFEDLALMGIRTPEAVCLA